MALPKPNLVPPFHIVRVAYVDWSITDMGYSREFYHDIVGYHIEDENQDTLSKMRTRIRSICAAWRSEITIRWCCGKQSCQW